MTLIASISGIRGTIGGRPREALTPIDIVQYASAFGTWVIQKTGRPKIVIGRDARISGELVSQLVRATLQALGIQVIDLGLSTTPTVEMAVPMEQAGGGIILTASHNPREWNALKLLNENGEFISAADGAEVMQYASEQEFSYCDIQKLGSYTREDGYMDKHIEAILNHPLVDAELIAAKSWKIVVDGINSSGSVFVPALLRRLGIEQIDVINADTHGRFQHNPEPLPENMTEICAVVPKSRADLGIVVDPDVDRLCFVCEDGSLFGEEYTLVAIADYILTHKPGNTVSNLSSTRALQDITLKHGGQYFASPVGEVHVVRKMKEVHAVIGGEGNGGIIVPELHYGRDALIGIALFLTHLARWGKPVSDLRRSYPDYYMSKNKIELRAGVDFQAIFSAIREKYTQQPAHTEDGLKIEFDREWVHLRASNTEPVIRIYAESTSESTAHHIANRLMEDIRECMRGQA